MNALSSRVVIAIILAGTILGAGCEKVVGPLPPGPLAVSPATLPLGVINRTYDFTFSVTAGKGTPTYSITQGALPTGMSLSSAGVLSGTPTEMGRFNFIVQAIASNGTATTAITLDIAEALALATATLPNGLLTNLYSQSLAATGGIPGYTWSLVDPAADPPGLDITDAGPGNATYGGTPTASGKFTFTVQVTDTGNAAVPAGSVTGTLSITILGAPAAFVANFGSGTVSVVDLGTNAVMATIGVGTNPHSVTLSPDSTTAYVTNNGSNNVSVIDTLTNAVITTIAVGAGPIGVTAPLGGFIYVANQTDNSLSVIEAATNAVFVTIDVPFPGAMPTDLKHSSDGLLVFLTLKADEKVIALNNDPTSPAFHSIVGVMDVGMEPTGLGFNTNSNQLFVANSADTTVSVIDVDQAMLDFTVGAAIDVGTHPQVIGIGPSSCNFTHVGTVPDPADPLANPIRSMPVFDINTETVVKTFFAGDNPQGIAFSPDGKQVYVALRGENRVVVLDTVTGSFLASIPVGTQPTGIAIMADPLFRLIPVTPEMLPMAVLKVEYKTRVCVAGGIGPYTFAESGGTVPPGLNMDDTGLISGKPTNPSYPDFPDDFKFNVTVTDSSNPTLMVTGEEHIQVCCIGQPDRVYVANFNDSTVSVINTFEEAVEATITSGLGTNPLGVALSPDSMTAYVSNFNSGNISVIDANPESAAFNTVTGLVSVGMGPSDMAVTPDGSRIYVANEDSNTVSVVDTGSLAEVATIAVGNLPEGVDITPDGKRVYVANIFSDTVSVIDSDPASANFNTVIATIAVDSGPVGVAMAPNGLRVYVTNQFSDTVSVIRTSDNVVLSSITVGNFPTGIIVADDARAYVANQLDDTVSVIDLPAGAEIDLDPSTAAVVDRIDVGTSPDFLSVSSSGFFVYVTNFGSDNVSTILNFPGSPDDNTILPNIAVGDRPEGIKRQFGR